MNINRERKEGEETHDHRRRLTRGHVAEAAGQRRRTTVGHRGAHGGDRGVAEHRVVRRSGAQGCWLCSGCWRWRGSHQGEVELRGTVLWPWAWVGSLKMGKEEDN